MPIDRTLFNLWVDEPVGGDGSTGTKLNKTRIANDLLTPIDNALAATVQTTTSTGTVNNFAATAADHLILFCNNASLLRLTGIVAGGDGDIIDVISIGAGQVDIAHQNSGSTGANQLTNFATSADTSIAAGKGAARYVYSTTLARWRLVEHNQGAWITPTFNAANYTGSGTMTWTVAAGDVVNYRYYLSGRQLSVLIGLITTTVGGTPSTELRAVIPGGYLPASGYEWKPAVVNDNGGGYITGAVQFDASAAYHRFYKSTALTANWTASTNLTEVFGSMTFEAL